MSGRLQKGGDVLSNQTACYTYFKIVGIFDPDAVSAQLQLSPDRQWRIGDRRRDGTEFGFALWEFGRCDNYDVYVAHQMMCTICPLLEKVEVLREIKQTKDVSFTLEVVPEVYAGEPVPCLAPSRQIMQFCCETGTELDIDLYVYDANSGTGEIAASNGVLYGRQLH